MDIAAPDPAFVLPGGKTIDGHKCYTVDEYREVAKIYVNMGFAIEQLIIQEQIIQEQKNFINISKTKVRILAGAVDDVVKEYNIDKNNWELELQAEKRKSKKAKLYKVLTFIGGGLVLGLGGALWLK